MMSLEDSGTRTSLWTDAEKRRFVKKHVILSGSALIFMVVFALLVHYETIKLYPQSMKGEILRNLSTKIEYALRYQSLQIFWLMFNILAVIYNRIKFMAINPLESNVEKNIQGYKNTLTNSFESSVISILSQLIFVTFAEPETVLKFIPYFNIVMFVGRIAFFIGYPLKRGFGVQCTLVPNIILVFYNIWSFFMYLFR